MNDNLLAGADGAAAATETLQELGARLVREVAAVTGEDEDYVDAVCALLGAGLCLLRHAGHPAADAVYAEIRALVLARSGD